MLHGLSWCQNVLILSTMRLKQYLKFDLSLKVPHLLALGHITNNYNTHPQTKVWTQEALVYCSAWKITLIWEGANRWIINVV